MNTLLLQLLTSRLSSSGDPRFAEVIARINGSAGTSPQDLLAQLGAQNPAIAKVLATINAQSGSRPVVLEGEPASRDEGGMSPAHTDDTRADEQTDSELKWLREHNDLIANALGACPKCWGRERACDLCDGNGKAGCYLPDEELFREFVAPAIRTLRASKEEQRVSVSAEPITAHA